jgi:CheY-like chemotaxis protein
MMKILLVGEDFRLLATRAAVLARMGANTVCCSPAEMLRDLQKETFDLVVMCHSLSETAATLVARTARLWWPGTKVLLIRANFGEEQDGIECDGVIESNPGEMVREATALLRALPAKPIDQPRTATPPPAIRTGHA